MNVVVVSGRLSSAPVVRELQSGSVLMSFELTTKVDGASVSVPLVWFDPPQTLTVDVGDEIAAVGTVRRRFYRAGGVTQSRTEVVVAHLGLATDKKSRTARQRWLTAAMGADDAGEVRSA
jgi:single-strand DNA-binding protein